MSSFLSSPTGVFDSLLKLVKLNSLLNPLAGLVLANLSVAGDIVFKAMKALHGTRLTIISVTFTIRILRSFSLSYHIIILCHLLFLLDSRRSKIIASLEPIKDQLVPVILKFYLLQLLTQILVLLHTLEIFFVNMPQLIVVLFGPLAFIQLQLFGVILAAIPSSSFFILWGDIIFLMLLRVPSILWLFGRHRLSFKDVISCDWGLLFLTRLHKHIVVFWLGI